MIFVSTLMLLLLLLLSLHSIQVSRGYIIHETQIINIRDGDIRLSNRPQLFQNENDPNHKPPTHHRQQIHHHYQQQKLLKQQQQQPQRQQRQLPHQPQHHIPRLSNIQQQLFRNSSNNNNNLARHKRVFSKPFDIAKKKNQINVRQKNATENNPAKNTLDVYIAGNQKDDATISKWHCTIMSADVGEGDASLELLRKESCPTSFSTNPMCKSFRECQTLYKTMKIMPVKGLTMAECLSVTMYTSDFYSVYNADTRLGKTDNYKIFTALLYTAVRKLDNMPEFSIVNGTVLYRGMKNKYDAPDQRFYFKQFISTTLDPEIAGGFVEEEVLLVPFESFEKIDQKKTSVSVIIELQASDRQDVIRGVATSCPNAKNNPSLPSLPPLPPLPNSDPSPNSSPRPSFAGFKRQSLAVLVAAMTASVSNSTKWRLETQLNPEMQLKIEIQQTCITSFG
ncbi:hypothetical protein HELRODRAFT_167086 [Helobdella robusta]|uniref:NAD(+)--protein-arginine ADP-ribosyltransferase n=1 Tax=Helobdella robusta TaxID=6412 RepID=T1EZ04_HELRO|nr:hypothetical protein HELRODRAFT_167086 [Helobdella robusta]ESO10584.1 hypothetical protein HELRODRAFT_167086 [Helobdella robusta]